MAGLLPPERDIGVLRAPVTSCLALAGVFLLVLLAVGLLERIGLRAGAARTAIVAAALTLFVLAALIAHSRRAADFYVADRKIAGLFGGLAGAGTFAGLLAVEAIGAAFGSGADLIAAITGLTLGYFLLGLLIAPRLSGFGAYTAGDFLAVRFGGFRIRLVWAVVAFVASFILFVAQLRVAGPLVAALFGISPANALYGVAGLTAVAALPGGMRSLTWTQAVQYFLVAFACLVPAGFLALRDPAAESAVAQELGAFLGAAPPLSEILGSQSLLPILLAALGAASLPQLLGRPLTASSAREASSSMVWSVLLSLVLVLSALVLAELLAGGATPQAASFAPDQLAVMLGSVSGALAGLLYAGVLAALFAVGQAALFSAASALSHDLYDEILDRKGPEGRRIVVARILLIGVAGGGVVLAPRLQAEAPALLQWALAIAAAGGFVPLILGLWWSRCSEIGALCGMLVGSGFAALAFLTTQGIIPASAIASDWTRFGTAAATMIGVAASFLVTVALTLAMPAAEAGERASKDGPAGRRGGPPIRERPA